MAKSRTLKLKRVFLWAIYQRLRSTPPKDFPTVAEIKSTIGDVLPALRASLEGYIDIFDRATDVQRRISSGELKVADEGVLPPELKALNEEIARYNKEHGSEIIEIVLPEEAFQTLSTQFNREDWGKTWLANLEEYGELLKAFDEA